MRHTTEMDQITVGARVHPAWGRLASNGRANRHTNTPEPRLNIPTRELVTTIIVATPMVTTESGATQQTRILGGTTAIIPTSSARLRRIAAIMAVLMTRTKPMVVTACAETVTLVMTAQFLHLVVPKSTVRGMEARAIAMQPMAATVNALTNTEDKIVPFHQLAAASTTAMGMPLWTWTAQMVVNATARMAGLETAAMCRHHARLPLIAQVMAPPKMQIPQMAASAVAKLDGRVKTVQNQRRSAAGP